MDLIILVIMIGLVIFFYRNFKNVIYFLGIVEIFLRLLHRIGDLLNFNDFNYWINSNFPNGILAMLSKYSSGLLYTIFVWIFVIMFSIFEYYLIKGFFKKGKK